MSPAPEIAMVAAADSQQAFAPRVPKDAAASLRRCAHCDAPAPGEGSEPAFCCDGCQTVWRVLHEGGLEDYYAVRAATSEERRTARTSDRAYTELDEPAFLDLYSKREGDGAEGAAAIRRIELQLQGIHCAACVWLIEKVPQLHACVVEARVDLGRGVVTLRWEQERSPLSRVARTIDSFGYPVQPLHGTARADLAREDERRLLARTAVAGACAANVMLLAFALYSGAFSGMEEEWSTLFRVTSLLVSLPSVLWSGQVFYRGAWAAIRTRAPHIDLPVSIGLLAGFFHGAANTLLGVREVYFDAVTTVIFLLLVGRVLQGRQQRLARSAAELLHALAPASARVLEEDRVRELPVEAVKLGAIVEVRAGERVPVDGVILEGRSAVDLSLLTGESVPVDVEVGDVVHAGCTATSGRLLLRADATGPATRVGRLLAEVEASAARRAPITLLADRVAGRFVFAILLIAAATFSMWLWLAGSAVAVDHTMALLIVSCPCALGLATPLAVAAAIGKGARAGLLIKGGDVLEALARPALVVFDKTGTLTEGKLSLAQIDGTPSATLLSRVRAAELCSAHPIARALVDGLPDDGRRIESVRQTLGAGLLAEDGGVQVAIGTAPFVASSLGVELPATLVAALGTHADAGHTPIVAGERALDGSVSFALFALADRIRADAPAALAALRARGHRLALLSGDEPRVAAAVAAELGAFDGPVRGATTPEEKLAFVESAKRDGPVFMVGDGVNDAGALAAATVGIAVHGGAEASLAAAHVFAAEPGVAPLVSLFSGAERTLRTIRLAMWLSTAYNLAGTTLAVLGWIHPLVAAIIMPVSSLTVVTIAYRSRTFDPKPRQEQSR